MVKPVDLNEIDYKLDSVAGMITQGECFYDQDRLAETIDEIESLKGLIIQKHNTEVND